MPNHEDQPLASDQSRLEQLYQLSLQVGLTLDLEQEAAAFMRWLAETVQPRLGGLFVADEARQELRLVAGQGFDLPAELRLPLGLDPWAWLRQQGVAVPGEEEAGRYAVPVVAEGQLFGTLCVVSSAGADNLSEEQRLVSTAAGYLAPILRNIRLYQSLEQMVAQRTAALRESEARYRAIVQDQTDLICRFRPDGTLVFVNEAYCRTFRRPMGELLGRSFLDLMTDEERQKFAQVLGQVTPEKPLVTLEHRSVLRDGSSLWIQWSVRALFDAEGHLVELQAVGRDITRRKQVVEELERYSRRLLALRELVRAILEAATPQAIATAAVQHLRQMVPCAAAAVILHRPDQTRVELLAIATQDRSHTLEGTYVIQDAFAGLEDVVRQLAEGQTWLLDDLQNHQPQSPAGRWVQSQGYRSALVVGLAAADKLIGVLVLVDRKPGAFTQAEAEIAQEVADVLAIALLQARLRQQVERHAEELKQQVAERTRQLTESEARYRQLVESPLVGIWQADVEGRFVYINQRLAQMSGYAPEEVIGKLTMLDVIAPEQRRWLADRMRRRRAGEPLVEPGEAVMLRKDGSRFTALVAPAGLYNSEGNFAGYIGAMLDITERKRLEEELAHRVQEQRKLINLMAGREVRMKELKEIIRLLRQQLQQAGLEPIANDPLAPADR